MHHFDTTMQSLVCIVYVIADKVFILILHFIVESSGGIKQLHRGAATTLSLHEPHSSQSGNFSIRVSNVHCHGVVDEF